MTPSEADMCIVSTINGAASLMACGHVVREIRRRDDGRLLFVFDESAGQDARAFHNRELFGSLPTAFYLARLLVRFHRGEIDFPHVQEVHDAAMAELDEAEN